MEKKWRKLHPESNPGLLGDVILWLVFAPITFFRRKYFRRQNVELLQFHNNKNFFCYKNKKDAEEFIIDKLIPIFADRVTFVNMKDENEEQKKLMTKFMQGSKNYPILIKIRNSNLIREPIFDAFYNAMFIDEKYSELKRKISKFFKN